MTPVFFVAATGLLFADAPLGAVGVLGLALCVEVVRRIGGR